MGYGRIASNAAANLYTGTRKVASTIASNAKASAKGFVREQQAKMAGAVEKEVAEKVMESTGEKMAKEGIQGGAESAGRLRDQFKEYAGEKIKGAYHGYLNTMDPTSAQTVQDMYAFQAKNMTKRGAKMQQRFDKNQENLTPKKQKKYYNSKMGHNQATSGLINEENKNAGNLYNSLLQGRMYENQRTKAGLAEHIGAGMDYGYGYFMSGTNTQKATRMGTAALGTYVAADGVHRALSGGSMLKNDEGEKDIVGIPFI